MVVDGTGVVGQVTTVPLVREKKNGRRNNRIWKVYYQRDNK